MTDENNWPGTVFLAIRSAVTRLENQGVICCTLGFRTMTRCCRMRYRPDIAAGARAILSMDIMECQRKNGRIAPVPTGTTPSNIKALQTLFKSLRRKASTDRSSVLATWLTVATEQDIADLAGREPRHEAGRDGTVDLRSAPWVVLRNLGRAEAPGARHVDRYVAWRDQEAASASKVSRGRWHSTGTGRGSSASVSMRACCRGRTRGPRMTQGSPGRWPSAAGWQGRHDGRITRGSCPCAPDLRNVASRGRPCGGARGRRGRPLFASSHRQSVRCSASNSVVKCCRQLRMPS